MLLPKWEKRSCCRNPGPLPTGSWHGCFFPGSHLLVEDYWFCLNSYYLAADFTQMSRLRVRGTNDFLAVSQKRDGLKRLPPGFSQPLVPEACGAWRVFLTALQGSVFPSGDSCSPTVLYLLH